MIINILGRDITVISIPDGDLMKMADEEHCLGYYHVDKIYLASSLTGDQKRRVLMHEMVHAVLGISGLTNLLDEKLEEAIADSMESLIDAHL